MFRSMYDTDIISYSGIQIVFNLDHTQRDLAHKCANCPLDRTCISHLSFILHGTIWSIDLSKLLELVYYVSELSSIFRVFNW